MNVGEGGQGGFWTHHLAATRRLVLHLRPRPQLGTPTSSSRITDRHTRRQMQTYRTPKPVLRQTRVRSAQPGPTLRSPATGPSRPAWLPPDPRTLAGRSPLPCSPFCVLGPLPWLPSPAHPLHSELRTRLPAGAGSPEAPSFVCAPRPACAGPHSPTREGRGAWGGGASAVALSSPRAPASALTAALPLVRRAPPGPARSPAAASAAEPGLGGEDGASGGGWQVWPGPASSCVCLRAHLGNFYLRTILHTSWNASEELQRVWSLPGCGWGGTLRAALLCAAPGVPVWVE